MKVYSSKYSQIPGSSYEEVMPVARKEFNKIRNRTKRRPYVRSKYFKGDKIFLLTFWDHLAKKHRNDKMYRLKLYNCAIDLLRNSTFTPDTKFRKDDLNIMLHRFEGKSNDKINFYVQVKQDKRTGRKDFMSVFPARKSRK